MPSSVNMIRPVVAELSVEVLQDDVDAALNKAYAMIGRTATIRGFRRGKVPRHVVRRMFGKAVRSEVKGDLMSAQFMKAIGEHQLEPLSTPEIESGELVEGEVFRFKATFEVRPRVDNINYEGVFVERQKVTVTEEDVSSELERVRAAVANVTELSEPRPARRGDVAAVAMKRWVDGEWQEGGLPDQEIVIGDGHAPDKMEEALEGMNVGDEKVVDLGSIRELDENRLRYLIRLNAIKERQLPELDDELAKDTGEFDTLDALKADIKEKILEARNRAEDQRIRTSLFDALCEKNEMDVPPSMLERHTDALKKQFLGSMEAVDGEGASDEEEDEKKEEAIMHLSEGAEKMARAMVHQHLLMMEIARLENISVSDEEVDEEIEREAALRKVPAPMLRKEMGKENRRQELLSSILEKKIFDFVKSVVTITEVNASATPEDAPEPDGEKPVEAEASGSDDAPKAKKRAAAKTEKKKATAKKSAADKGAAKKKASRKKASKKTADKAEAKKTTAKKTTAKKTAAKKTAAKKTAAKKTTAKKTAAKKSTAKKSAAKTTAKKKK